MQSMDALIREAMETPVMQVCGCGAIIRMGRLINGRVSHGTCLKCFDETLTKMAQDRAYRLTCEVAEARFLPGIHPDDALELTELWLALLGFIQSGGGLGREAEAYMRSVYNIEGEQKVEVQW